MKVAARRFSSAGWACGVGLLFLLAGCASRQSPSAAEFPLSEANKDLARGTLAAVEIRGQPRVTVLDTTESVFTEAGFTLAGKAPDRLTFERPATRGQVAAYGNWFGDGSVRIRLRVDVVQQGTRVFFLTCRSFAIREAGQISEDEQPLARRKVRAYEDLLYEVAKRLN